MGKDLSIVKDIVFICNGSTCLKKGAEENTNVLRNTIKEHNLHDHTHTIKTRCTGQCEHGPIVFLHPEGVWYGGIDLPTSGDIVTEHLLKREVIQKHLLFKSGPSDQLANSEILVGKL